MDHHPSSPQVRRPVCHARPALFSLGLGLLFASLLPLAAAPPKAEPPKEETVKKKPAQKPFVLPPKRIPPPPIPNPPAQPPPHQEPPPQPPPIVEPTPPVTGPEKPGEKPRLDRIVRLSETRYRIGEIEFAQDTRSITFPAAINMDKGMLEYAIVTASGKVHEALLSTRIPPFDLNVAMLLLRYEKAANFFPPGFLPPEEQAPPGSPQTIPDATNSFDIRVSWKDGKGKEHTLFLEDLIRNEAEKKKAKRAPWVYTGSVVDPNGNFGAQVSGSIVALFTDTLAIMNNPREGSDSDEIWLVGENVPPLQTEVMVTLVPHEPVKAEPKK